MRDLLIRLVAKFQRRPCCYLHFGLLPCLAAAEWMLIEPGKHPADAFTDACTRHVGPLLTDSWTIYVTPILIGGHWGIVRPM